MTIKFWDLEEGKCTKTISGHEHNVSYVTYSFSGNIYYLVLETKQSENGMFKSGAQKKIFKGHKDWVRYLVISPDQKAFASTGNDKLIKIWDLNNTKGECSKTIGADSIDDPHTNIIDCLDYSNAEADKIIIKHLLKGDIQKEEKLAAKAREASYTEEKEEDPGGAFLISGSRDKTIKMYSVTTGKLVLSLNAHDNWVRGLVFHPTGKYFLSCSDDKSIKVWNLEKSGQLERKLETAHDLFVTSIAWCNSMDLMASGGVDNHVKVWDCTP
eukprot:TRINITY_DN3620_c0_g1_i1.p1 TRINITY_DN3620_c0_g1~~TRINITY_DN3620_c0_g1_i1.p1  ORF type:complete len:270 (-),score=47.00 TRINITY_DN3620_c0_g1_i1:220-1029(-)